MRGIPRIAYYICDGRRCGRHCKRRPQLYNTMCLAIEKEREVLELILIALWLFSGKKSQDNGTTTADR